MPPISVLVFQCARQPEGVACLVPDPHNGEERPGHKQGGKHASSVVRDGEHNPGGQQRDAQKQFHNGRADQTRHVALDEFVGPHKW